MKLISNQSVITTPRCCFSVILPFHWYAPGAPNNIEIYCPLRKMLCDPVGSTQTTHGPFDVHLGVQSHKLPSSTFSLPSRPAGHPQEETLTRHQVRDMMAGTRAPLLVPMSTRLQGKDKK